MDNPYMQKNYPMTQSMKVVFCSKLFKNDSVAISQVFIRHPKVLIMN